MNFTTDLPKKSPEVTYIVASAVKCERFFPNSKNEGPLFRMHAVMLYRNEPTIRQQSDEPPQPEPRRYVLCHIRKLDASYKASTARLTKPIRNTSHRPFMNNQATKMINLRASHRPTNRRRCWKSHHREPAFRHSSAMALITSVYFVTFTTSTARVRI
jgi:hypothetical protein